MFDEPHNGIIGLYGVNDTAKSATIEYTVTDVLSGNIVAQGGTELGADSSRCIDSVAVDNDDERFLYIEWVTHGKKSDNHYMTKTIDINFENYMTAIEKCGYNESKGLKV